jgi:ribonuclease D
VWSDRNPVADKRLKSARAAIAVVSAEVDIPVENLLTPELLRRLAWTPPEPLELESVTSALAGLGARAWQVDAIAQVILDAFVDASQTIEPGVETAS